MSKPMTDKQIARAIAKYARKRTPLTLTWLKQQDISLACRAIHRFGNWNGVLRAAGLKTRRKPRWSQEKVVRRIRMRHERGRSLRSSHMNREASLLLQAGTRYFGSWRKAVEAAGFDYDSISWGKKRTMTDTADDLRNWVQEHGPLNYKSLEETDEPLVNATRKYFGSVEQAAEVLGLPHFYRNQRWSKECVMAALAAREREGRSLKATDVGNEDHNLYNAALRYFKTWVKAVAASGIAYKPERQSHTRETLARDLRAWCREHGSLNSTSLKKTNHALLRAVERRFGSIRKAAHLLGLPYQARQASWSPEKVIKGIRNRLKKRRSTKPGHVYEQDRNLYNAALRYFGTWDSAQNAARANHDG